MDLICLSTSARLTHGNIECRYLDLSDCRAVRGERLRLRRLGLIPIFSDGI